MNQRDYGKRIVEAARPAFRAAFTLTELIVVMSIILILLAVAVPTFRSTLASSESSNAETKLRLALLAGRDAALHSDRGADTAVVFMFEPGGRSYAMVCEYAGTIPDVSDGGAPIDRDVFVPVPIFEPVQFPAGYMVRGFVPAGMLSFGNGNLAPSWYEGGRYTEDERNWVFPETGFYDAIERDDGADRQSFMVRFVGGIGAVAVGDTREALVLDPRPTAAGRTAGAWSIYRVDATEDMGSVVRRAIARLSNQGGLGGGGVVLTQLFGDESGDTILCRTVEQLVLYKESELANAIGVKLDPDTGSLYRGQARRGTEWDPEYVPRFSGENELNVRRWLEGDTNFDGEWLDVDDSNPDRPVARIYTVSRYTAALEPVPLINLDDISSNLPGGAP